jgi:hypothetical protein
MSFFLIVDANWMQFLLIDSLDVTHPIYMFNIFALLNMWKYETFRVQYKTVHLWYETLTVLYWTLKVSHFSTEPFFAIQNLKKGFVRDGSTCGYSSELSKGSVEFFIFSFETLDTFGCF